MFLRIVIIFSLVRIAAVEELHGQAEDNPYLFNRFRNTMAIGASFDYLFNENSMMQPFGTRNQWLLNQGTHIRFSHKLNSNFEFQAGLGIVWTYYNMNSGSEKNGDIITSQRFYETTSLDLRYFIFNSPGFTIDFSSGLLLRTGSEMISTYASYSLGCDFGDGRSLNGLGHNTGIRFCGYLSKGRIQLAFEPVYTFMFFRWAGWQDLYKNETGPPKNMTRLIFTTGYRLFKMRRPSSVE